MYLNIFLILVIILSEVLQYTSLGAIAENIKPKDGLLDGRVCDKVHPALSGAVVDASSGQSLPLGEGLGGARQKSHHKRVEPNTSQSSVQRKSLLQKKKQRFDGLRVQNELTDGFSKNMLGIESKSSLVEYISNSKDRYSIDHALFLLGSGIDSSYIDVLKGLMLRQGVDKTTRLGIVKAIIKTEKLEFRSYLEGVFYSDKVDQSEKLLAAYGLAKNFDSEEALKFLEYFASEPDQYGELAAESLNYLFYIKSGSHIEY